MIADSERIAAHVAKTRYEDLPAAAVAKVKTFLLDTIGVGIAGSSGAKVGDLATLAATWGNAPEATVWPSGQRMSAGSAAMVNAYQIHCLEYDCVHEGAVLHPMATILGAVLAWAEREATKGLQISGRELITAIALGVDVSTMLGIVTDAPIRFFRPATAGGFGAAAAIARLSNMHTQGVLDTLGAQYSQASGTLQPHAEGSPMLGMQVGFNARAAIISADLAAAGFRGPHDIFTGQYGYLPLFEQDRHNLPTFLNSLGKDWQILHVSHKPYPSGRLTHGVVDGLQRLMFSHGFRPADIASIRADVPPLVHRLVGRADIPNPEPNYAKLCLRFVAGTYLAKGKVDVANFRGDALADPLTHHFASRVDVILDSNTDQNALDPQVISVTLGTGEMHSITLPHVYGHPTVPLTQQENEAKFLRCLTYAVGNISMKKAEAMIETIAQLEDLPDITSIIPLALADLP